MTTDNELRKVDILAKVARVNMRDTTKVLVALRLYASKIGIPVGQLVEEVAGRVPYAPPDDDNVVACHEEYKRVFGGKA